MSKYFLIFLSFTLINTVTFFSSRNMQDQPMDTEVEVVEEDIEDEETTSSEEVEETPTKESKDGTENTTESPIDGQTSEDDETDTSEEETPEEKPEILPDIDIELTDEEKALVFKYIGKVDMEYLMSLSSDGISEDENLLIIDHLKERLTEEEYGEVEGLIIRFLYSLE